MAAVLVACGYYWDFLLSVSGGYSLAESESDTFGENIGKREGDDATPEVEAEKQAVTFGDVVEAANAIKKGKEKDE